MKSTRFLFNKTGLWAASKLGKRHPCPVTEMLFLQTRFNYNGELENAIDDSGR